ncbi:hypothetical protein ACE3NQ_04580 [Paenibacillus terreus]|uniref:Uncharacterized protein n=1 Tax=Paenibacillus terreus TaxID=1387834 RepID=A0ABV5B3E1_9BACL
MDSILPFEACFGTSVALTFAQDFPEKLPGNLTVVAVAILRKKTFSKL